MNRQSLPRDITPSSSARARVAVIAPSATTLLPLRGGLLRAILAKRHRVLCLAPEFPSAIVNELASLGIECAGYGAGQSRLAVRRDIQMARALIASLKDWRPQVVFGYGATAAIIGALAARAAATPHIVAMFSGLDGVVPRRIDGLPESDGQGKRFSNRRKDKIGRRRRLQRWLALRSADALILHNEDDKRRLQDMNLLPGALPVHVVRGAGVDLDLFTPQRLPALDDGLTFVMIAQMRQAKGILDFCEAALRVKARSPTVKFVLVGGADDSTAGISMHRLRAYSSAVRFAGRVDDVRPYLASAHIFVLPSRHGEGLSKTIMEALAVGRPIITSKIPGCAETVDERVNGCLVAPGDQDALVAAMQSFLRRPDLIPAMAHASRAKAERRYGAGNVNRDMLKILNIE